MGFIESLTFSLLRLRFSLHPPPLVRNAERSSQGFKSFHVLSAELSADLLKQTNRLGRVQVFSTTQTDFRRDGHRSEINTPTEELFGLLRNDFSITHRALIEWNHPHYQLPLSDYAMLI